MINQSFIQSKLLLVLLALSCSSKPSTDQAVRYITNGLTCDAVLTSNENVLICGESKRYNSDGDSDNKDALCVLVNAKAKVDKAFSYGNQNINERCERIVAKEKAYYMTGTSGDEKLKFLLKTDLDGKPIWSAQSNLFKTIDQPELAVNNNGFSLFSSKNPTDESYQVSFHLFNTEGSCNKSFKLSSVDMMQDIIPLKDGNFLVSYKQKGAYIDGQTRKRYLMNTFHKFNEQGEMLTSQKFLFDDDQVHGLEFSKVLEDKNGHLYFIGTIDIQKGNEQLLYILKSDAAGQVLWSKMYAGVHDMRLRSACWNVSGNLMVLGDGYGKKGGIIVFEVGVEGNSIWAKQLPSPQYDQAIAVIDDAKHYRIIVDKLFTIGSIHLDRKGNSCLSEFQTIKLEPQNLDVLSDRFNGKMELIENDWKPAEFQFTEHKVIETQSDCN